MGTITLPNVAELYYMSDGNQTQKKITWGSLFMKATMIFLHIMIFCRLSYGLVISGTLTDSTSGVAIDSAVLKFRIGLYPDEYPKAQSDTMGFFRKEVSVEYGYPLLIWIEKNGYNSKGINFTVVSDSIDLGTILIKKHFETAIIISGTVIDSMTQKAFSGVTINLKKNIEDVIPYMSFTTDQSGFYNQTLTLSNDTPLFLIISSTGYYQYVSVITEPINSVNQTIHLQPEGSLRIKVSGQVVDSTNGLPVSNAKLLFFTTYNTSLSADKQDIAYTDNDGRFTGSVTAGVTSAAMPALYVSIISDGYIQKNTSKILSISDPYEDLDLGAISIVKNSSLPPSGVQLTKINTTIQQTKNHSFLTLNGRLVARNNDTRNSRGASSQLLVRMNKNCREKNLNIKSSAK